MVRKINEMATDKSSAIESCRSLGRRFIEHFIKLVDETPTGLNFKHHCNEMQTWYSDAESIILKYNNKKISNTQLSDWFFTCGETTENLMSNKYTDIYEDFIATIIYKRTKRDDVSIFDIAKELL